MQIDGKEGEKQQISKIWTTNFFILLLDYFGPYRKMMVKGLRKSDRLKKMASIKSEFGDGSLKIIIGVMAAV